MKRSPLLWLRKKLHRAFRFKKYSSQMIWFLMGVYIINKHYMAAWRYIISLLVSKNIALVCSAPQDTFFIKREIPYLRADMQYPFCVASYSNVKKRVKGLFIVESTFSLSSQFTRVSMGWCLLGLSAKISALLRLLLNFFSYG